MCILFFFVHTGQLFSSHFCFPVLLYLQVFPFLPLLVWHLIQCLCENMAVAEPYKLQGIKAPRAFYLASHRQACVRAASTRAASQCGGCGPPNRNSASRSSPTVFWLESPFTPGSLAISHPSFHHLYCLLNLPYV